MSYTLHIQKTKTSKYRICLVSADNGKLVMQGEPLTNRKDAKAVYDAILNTYSMGGSPIMEGRALKADHKFVKNSGPKKGAVKKVGLPVGRFSYSILFRSPAGKPKKKAPKKR